MMMMPPQPIPNAGFQPDQNYPFVMMQQQQHANPGPHPNARYSLMMPEDNISGQTFQPYPAMRSSMLPNDQPPHVLSRRSHLPHDGQPGQQFRVVYQPMLVRVQPDVPQWPVDDGTRPDVVGDYPQMEVFISIFKVRKKLQMSC